MASLILVKTGWPNRALSPNARVHHQRKAAAARAARREAYWSTVHALPRGWKANGERYVVTIAAHPAVSRKRDADNLIASVKPHLDGIADALGVNDSLFDVQPVQWGERMAGGWLFFGIEPRP
jgi:crossover junction endodeoxyribonuclease RusA